MLKKVLLGALLLFWFLSLGSFAFAQRPLEVGYPEVAGFKPEVITQDLLPKFVIYIFDFSVGLTGLIAVAVLIYAGFRYFLSGGSPGIKADAKKRIGEAILGLGIVLGSYLILTTVNPQLTFLDLKIKKTDLKPAVIPELEQKTLLAEEIPVGYLMATAIKDFKDKDKLEEGLYAETRFGRIKGYYQNLVRQAKDLQEAAAELKTLSESLKKMSDSCGCGKTASVAGWCAFDSCPLKERPFCQGDPCWPNRPAIESLNNQIQEKRKFIFTLLYQGAGVKAVDEATKKIYFPDDQSGRLEWEGILNNDNETEAGFLYWQQRLGFEIKDFERISGVFLSAQNKISSCSGFQGLQDGKPAALFNRFDFRRWQEITDAAAKYEKVEVKPWQNARPRSDDNATFYCAQQEFGAIPTNLPGQEIAKEVAPANLENPKVSCEKTITLGNMFDSSNDLAKKTLAELQNFYQKTQTIFNSTAGVLGIKNLQEAIDAIRAWGCDNGCRPWIEPWRVCWDVCDSDGSCHEECNYGEDKCCVIGRPPKGGRGDGQEPGCSRYIAEFICNGIPSSEKISAPQSNIDGSVLQFTSLSGVIKNEVEVMEKTIIPNLEELFIEKTGEGDKKTTQPEKRIEELAGNQKKLADPFCSNPKSDWEGFLAGETVMEKSFYSAQEVESMGWVKNITNKNNFYCCSSKASVPK